MPAREMKIQKIHDGPVNDPVDHVAESPAYDNGKSGNKKAALRAPHPGQHEAADDDRDADQNPAPGRAAACEGAERHAGVPGQDQVEEARHLDDSRRRHDDEQHQPLGGLVEQQDQERDRETEPVALAIEHGTRPARFRRRRRCNARTDRDARDRVRLPAARASSARISRRRRTRSRRRRPARPAK